MYKDILFPLDITEKDSYGDALEVVLEYIAAFKARLHIMTVVADYGVVQQYLPKGSIEKIVDEANEDLHKFVEDNIPKNVETQHIIAKGAVYECIIETARKVDADLIVMSAHRPELKDYLLGPNAAKVVRHSDRSVLVVREKNNKH